MPRPTDIIVCIMLFCSLLPAVIAQEEFDGVIKDYSISMYIEYKKVLVESEISVRNASGDLSIELPLDAKSIEVSVDGKKIEPLIQGDSMFIPIKSDSVVGYSFITSDFLDRDSLLVSITPPAFTGKMRIKVWLPDKATLQKPVRAGAIQGSSVLPKPSSLETDGKIIGVNWVFSDVDEAVNLFVAYQMPLSSKASTYFLLVGIIVVVAALLFIFIFRNKDGTRKVVHASKATVDARESNNSEKSQIAHLKEDEEQVVSILRMREGRCDQGTLRVVTGFSKAKLSMLLKELQEREVIHKEKTGKKNLVFLKEL